MSKTTCSAIAALIIASSTSMPLAAQELDHLKIVPRKATAAEEQELLDLDGGRLSAAKPQYSSSCDGEAPLAASQSVQGSKAGCQAKRFARSASAIGSQIARHLWCSDASGLKAAAMEAAKSTAMQAQRISQEMERRQVENRFDMQKPFEFFGFAETLRRGNATPRAQAGPVPSKASIPDEGARLMAWSSMEEAACRSWGAVSSQLAPSISTQSVGHINAGGADCEGSIVTARFSGWRGSPSRISWIASFCPQFAAPGPEELASAIQQGALKMQEWQDSHLAKWGWQGAPAPAAIGRSAGAQP